MRDAYGQHKGVIRLLFFLLRKDNRIKKKAIGKKDWTVLENKIKKYIFRKIQRRIKQCIAKELKEEKN